jgi:hypothetical protein
MSRLRNFGDLSLTEKVLVILGVVACATSKERAIELSGIDMARLSRMRQNEVERVFSGDQVMMFRSALGGERYILKWPAWRRLAQTVRYKSVAAQIGDTVWEETVAPDNKP